MRPLYKSCWLKLPVLSIALLLISCEKMQQYNNTDPYSDSKNIDYSLIGFYWAGVEYVQVADIRLVGRDTRVYWGLVKIDEEEYILISASVWDGTYDLSRMRTYHVWFIFPYQDVIVGKEYTANIYPSVVGVSAPVETYPFFVDGEARNECYVPLAATVKYSRKGKYIQGSFTATGAMEMVDGSVMDIVLENGTFNLSYSSHYIKTWSIDQWLSDMYRY